LWLIRVFPQAADFKADRLLAQRMSDRAVKVIQATEAGELLARGFAEAIYFECKFCCYTQRCWGGAL
jgi:hypothetical protein